MRASDLLLVDDFFNNEYVASWARLLLLSAGASVTQWLSDATVELSDQLYLKHEVSMNNTIDVHRCWTNCFFTSNRLSPSCYYKCGSIRKPFFLIFLLLHMCHSTIDSDSICIFHKCLDNSGCAYYVC